VTSLTELPLQGNGLTSDISSTPRPAYQFGTAEASGKRSYLPLGAAALPQLLRNRCQCANGTLKPSDPYAPRNYKLARDLDDQGGRRPHAPTAERTGGETREQAGLRSDKSSHHAGRAAPARAIHRLLGEAERKMARGIGACDAVIRSRRCRA